MGRRARGSRELPQSPQSRPWGPFELEVSPHQSLVDSKNKSEDMKEGALRRKAGGQVYTRASSFHPFGNKDGPLRAMSSHRQPLPGPPGADFGSEVGAPQCGQG